MLHILQTIFGYVPYFFKLVVEEERVSRMFTPDPGYPRMQSWCISINLEPRAGAIVTAILGMLYVVFVWGMRLSGWFAKEGDIKRKWNDLNK